MISRFLNELDECFNGYINYLNLLGKSTILQNAIYDLFERLIFTSLINSFFSNLTDKNIKEWGLSNKEVDELKKYFSDTIKEIKRDSKQLDFKVDIEYYNKFILDVANHFPNYIKCLNDVEKSINIETIKEYLILKKEIIQESGKKIENEKDFLFIKSVEKYIDEYKDIPDLNDDKLLKILLDIPKDKKVMSEALKRFSGMAINDWDIWHSYSSYFFDEIPEIGLGTIAVRLVKSGFCPLVFGSSTEFMFKEDDELKLSKLEAEILDFEQFKYNTKVFPKGYPLLLLEQSASMWFFEWKLFSEEYRRSFPYIRCFLNPCYLKKGPRTIGVYPQIKIYSNGVFILSFREISSKETYYLESFIHNEVNLPKQYFDQILVPPELIKLNSKGAMLNQPLLQILLKRNQFKATNKEINKIIKENTEIITGDFEFQVVPITLEENQMFNLEDLIDIILDDLFYAVNPPSKKILRKKINYLTDFRAIRPSIYILEFENQPHTSSEILEKYDNQLGQIMSRVSNPSLIDYRKFLGENLREFEDFTLHINEALVLWTISKKALESKKIDPNRDELILDKQIQVEAIDHLYLSHRRLFDISSNLNIPYKSVILDQLAFLNLEELVTDCSNIGNYGEIDALMKVVGEKLHWEDIRKSTEKKLKLRSEYSNEERNNLLSRFGNIITFTFGIGSLTIFTIYVIIPLLYNFNIISDNPMQISLWGSITILFIIILIFFLLFLTGRFVLKNKSS